MDYRTCISESVYKITYGRRYEVFGANPRNIRIRDDRGRKIWIPRICFDKRGAAAPAIQQVIINDDLAESDHAAIEVDVILDGGERRWCWFATPTAAVNFGDILGDPLAENPIRITYGVPHLIIVSAIDAQIIAAALDQIQRSGKLLRCTLAIDDTERQAEVRENVLLSLQRALLGAISPAVRGIACWWEEESIHITAVFDGPITGGDSAALSQAEAKVRADFRHYQVQLSCQRLDAPEPLAIERGTWVYVRKE